MKQIFGRATSWKAIFRLNGRVRSNSTFQGAFGVDAPPSLMTLQQGRKEKDGRNFRPNRMDMVCLRAKRKSLLYWAPMEIDLWHQSLSLGHLQSNLPLWRSLSARNLFRELFQTERIVP